ncbi:MAG: DUF6248 family natural product biosynthesis protein [Actinomyces massiliensis]
MSTTLQALAPNASNASTASPASTACTASNAGNASPARMTEAEAAWVREHVWTPAIRKGKCELWIGGTHCPCQYGPCGHCAAGDHAHCPYEQANPSEDVKAWAQRQSDTCAGYLTDARGAVMADFWEVGVRHDARCPCWKNGHPGAEPPNGYQTTIYDFI